MPQIPWQVLQWLQEEHDRAHEKFGPLTKDNFRAYALLGEEVGEVAKNLVEIGKAETRLASESLAADQRSYNERLLTLYRKNARAELIQVMSLAVGLIKNLAAADDWFLDGDAERRDENDEDGTKSDTKATGEQR